MARPQRNNVDYFPFLCDEGNKMFYLEETYGNDGFAVFVKLLRELAKTDYHYLDLSKNTTRMFLSAKCKVSKDILEAIINDLVELEKFDVQLWKENSIVWCQDFIDSIQDAYSKRSNKCIDKKGLINLLISKGVRKQDKKPPKQPKQPSDTPVNPQSKVKKSKVKENKEEKNIPTQEEFVSYAMEKGENLDKQKVILKYQSWVENGWQDGNDNEIKNWKSKVLSLLTYDTLKIKLGFGEKPPQTGKLTTSWSKK